MEISNDILTMAALVAAAVGTMKNFGVPSKYSPLAALALAAVFVLVPDPVQTTIIKIAVIGLTASGAYHYTKNQTGGDGDGKGV